MSEESAIAVRDKEPTGAAVMKAVPIPTMLQEQGVRIIEEEGTRMRAIVLPPAVRQNVNLLTPVSSFAQSDPNWTPSVSLVQLDPGHVYDLPGGKKGLSKQALETLGRCAGILYTKTSRVPQSELADGELYAYRATIGLRRSDGTVEEISRERSFDREVEFEDISNAVESGSKTKGWERPAKDAEIKKRWIAELRFGRAKTESKAVNRAIRAALGIPTSVTQGELSKPWLVVGFNFTPDYDDPEIKRALVAIGLKAGDAVYGAADRALPAAPEPAEDET